MCERYHDLPEEEKKLIKKKIKKKFIFKGKAWCVCQVNLFAISQIHSYFNRIFEDQGKLFQIPQKNAEKEWSSYLVKFKGLNHILIVTAITPVESTVSTT